MATILIIEDDPTIVGLLTEVLTQEGYAVVAALDIDALRLARDDHIDCILLDLMLPYLEGVAILHYLRSHPATKQIPVIVTSAVGHIETSAILLGAYAVLQKPFALDELLRMVRGAIATSEKGNTL